MVSVQHKRYPNQKVVIAISPFLPERALFGALSRKSEEKENKEGLMSSSVIVFLPGQGNFASFSSSLPFPFFPRGAKAALQSGQFITATVAQFPAPIPSTPGSSCLLPSLGAANIGQGVGRMSDKTLHFCPEQHLPAHFVFVLLSSSLSHFLYFLPQ